MSALCLALPLSLSGLAACSTTDTGPDSSESASTSTPRESTGTPEPAPRDEDESPDEACPSSFTTAREGDEVRADLDEFTGEGTVWLCSYSAAGSDERHQEWLRTSTPVALDSATTSVVTDLVAGLAPADENQPCRANFGPVLVLSQEIRDAEQAHLVIEDFGCNTAQLATNLANSTLGWNEPRLDTPDGTITALNALPPER